MKEDKSASKDTDSRKEKGTSPKDLDLAKSEQDKITGGTIEKQTVEKQSIEKQAKPQAR